MLKNFQESVDKVLSPNEPPHVAKRAVTQLVNIALKLLNINRRAKYKLKAR